MSDLKKNIFRIAILVLTISALYTSAFSSVLASNQLSSYEADVVHLGNGKLEILVSVIGTDYMDTIGASNIIIYEPFGSSWIACNSIPLTYPGMTSEDSIFHEDYVYVDVEEDAYLKVEVIIYAKDYSGESDARILTYYVYT